MHKLTTSPLRSPRLLLLSPQPNPHHHHHQQKQKKSSFGIAGSPPHAGKGASHHEVLRRAPRIPSALAATSGRGPGISMKCGAGDRRIVPAGGADKCLRRSPRLAALDLSRKVEFEGMRAESGGSDCRVLSKKRLRSRKVRVYFDWRKDSKSESPPWKSSAKKHAVVGMELQLQEEITPVPLKIHDPKQFTVERKSLRRSPRLRGADVGSSIEEIRAEKTVLVRNSEGLREGGRRRGGKVLLLGCSKQFLRRSSRLMEGSIGLNEGSNLPELSNSMAKFCSERSLRQSQRLMGSSMGSREGSKFMALPDSAQKGTCELIRNCFGESDMLNKKCLRPREVTVSFGKRKSSCDVNPELSERLSPARKKLRSSDEDEQVSLAEANVPMVWEKSLRKSPRLSSSLDEKGHDHMVSIVPRPTSSFDEKSSLKSRNITSQNSTKILEEERVLRRSPRGLVSLSVIDDGDESNSESEPLPKRKKKQRCKNRGASGSIECKEGIQESECFFIGEPLSDEEAREWWRWRYERKNRRVKDHSLTVNDDEEDDLVLNVKCHYTQVQISGTIFDLGDCAYIWGEEGRKHIGRIIELFQTTHGEEYCRIQWFYRAEDTVMKEEASFHDKRRIFYSTLMNDNPLNCIISKVNVIPIMPQLDLRSNHIPPSDYYYDMEYSLDYSTFCNLQSDKYLKGYCCSPFIRTCPTYSTDGVTVCGDFPVPFCKELSLLDLYSGCGAMSTGLNYGAKLSGVDITTRWAVDFDSFACESLKLNHPETQVRNEAAEDFLELLKQWEILCKKYVVQGVERTFQSLTEVSTAVTKDMPSQSHDELATGEYEVMNLVDVSYGDPDESGKRGLKFKVRWKGYGSDKDTWEPIEGLSNCQELIQDFVTMGFKTRILPLPGDADVICGGPPCQGISGYNRFRSVDAPLDDDRNRQIIVFMDIVEFLKPKYVLMENVTDILRFDRASLGRYALSRLVHMHYQARVGIMAAGCYGLPQFRLRVFFWGALPSEDLPQFPLPTHDVVVRYWPPSEFERNVVGYDEGQPRELEDPVLLHHAISDLPPVRNDEVSDEMPYTKPPETEFQNFIRSTKTGISKAAEGVLYDHLPYKLFEDDYIRVCQIPRRKGANFRDLPGLIVGDDNVVRRDPTKDLALLPSGKPIVPDYVFTFEQGKSKRPFGRLWWDETLPTLITYPNCHSQKILHPEQDRLLTVRECARLQGFPDYYRLCGSVKKRYRQVGNAVPIPVGRALGYSLGMAYQKLAGKDPLMKLPPKFAYSHILPSSSS